MRGRPLSAQDGRIGSIVDVYFDDVRWSVRYLVVDTGHAMPQREVLIHAEAIAREQPSADSIRVLLTRAEVERSPEADVDMPVYLQYGMGNAARYGDPHLRSSEIVIGYGIQVLDGTMGHVDDMLVDDRTWSIASLVVATRNWLPGKHVLVSPDLVRGVDRPDRKVQLRLTRSELRKSPAI